MVSDHFGRLGETRLFSIACKYNAVVIDLFSCDKYDCEYKAGKNPIRTYVVLYV